MQKIFFICFCFCLIINPVIAQIIENDVNDSVSISYDSRTAISDSMSTMNTDTVSKLEDFDDIGILYRYEKTFGLIAHSNGLGFNFRKGKHITGYSKRILEMEFVTMKHPKEYKVYNPARENAKGYIYGKLNSAILIRPTIGLQGVINSKAEKSGVEVRYIIQGGGSFCLLKPVYLDVLEEVKGTGEYRIVTERYDPIKHFTYNIYGKAPYLQGIVQTSVLPGAVGKLGLSFEYGKEPKKIKSIETGVSLDLFFQTVPIMADIDQSDGLDANNRFFLTFYLSINYGKKW